MPLAGAGLGQCQLDGMVNHIEDVVFPGKAHLDLGRVHIHIHQVCRHIQQQDTARELALHHGALERHFHTGHDGAVADVASIDVKMLHAAAGAAALGRGDETPDVVDTLLVVHFHKVPAELPAQHRVGRAPQLTVTGGDVLQFAFPDEFDAHLRVAEGHMGDRVGHEGALAGVLFEELHTGGGIVEQILHPDGGAHGTGARLTGELFPALDAVHRGKFVLLGAGGQLHPGHTGNGGQCLAAEAQCMDADKVVRRLDLAGGVSDESSGDVFGFNAGAVVADLDQLHAAGLNAHGDLAGTRVDGVFQQLLDNGRRTFNYLTGCDQLGGVLVQNMDHGHGRSLPCAFLWRTGQPFRLPFRVFLSS